MSGGHIEWKPPGETEWHCLPVRSVSLNCATLGTGLRRELPRGILQASVLIAATLAHHRTRRIAA